MSVDNIKLEINFETNPDFIYDDNLKDLIYESLNESINSSGLKLNQCQLNLTTEFYTKLISISELFQMNFI